MARAGSFNVPGNWIHSSGATTRGPQGNINVDQSKARKYFRGLTPGYNFTDDQLDILIAGQDIPGPAGDYAIPGSGIRAKAVATPTSFDLPGGPAVEPGGGSQAPQPPGENATDEEIDAWRKYTQSPEYQATLSGAGAGSTGAGGGGTEPQPPPPPPGPGGFEFEEGDPSDEKREVVDEGDMWGGTGPQGPAQPRYDVEGDRFYGIGGQYIDPITGIVLGDYEPVGATDLKDVLPKDYSEVFDPVAYGILPGRTLDELRRVGLGIEYIWENAAELYAQNPDFLQSWWQNTFLPVYNQLARNATGSVETTGGGTAFNPFGAAWQLTHGASPIPEQNLLFPSIPPINLSTANFSVDPGVSDAIRSGVAQGIDPFTAADFGIGPDDLDAFFGPITDRMSGLYDDFQRGGYTGVSDLLGNLENRLGRIESFDAGQDFLRDPTTSAQNLLDILYGTGGGTGPAAGIAGFRAPDSIQQLSDTIGTFGPQGTGIGGRISALQDALGGIDLSGLTAPSGLDDLVSQITNLGALTSPAIAGLGQLQTALGGFNQQDRAALDMLMQIIGPDGIASLNPYELTEMLEQFRGLAAGAFDLSDFGLPDFGLPDFGALIDPTLQGLLGPQSDFYKNVISKIPTAESIAQFIELPEITVEGVPGPGTGQPPGTGDEKDSVDTGDLSSYLKSLKAGIKGTSALDTTPITEDYLREEDVTTKSFLADLAEQQEQDEQEMLEQLQRFGIITSGEAGEQMFDLASAQRREELDVLSDAAGRVEEERRGRYSDALELGKVLQQREIGLAELLGMIDGEKTLAGREYDLDILATVIAAMDPNLDLTGSSEEQAMLASVLLEMLNRDPNATASDFIKQIRESLNLPGKK
ncbi:MAG: hypothetical protein Unbinned2851contig1000_22 [Prokaryotic dsDNA virus sp.]|nr:MAG: hypothetical protein Unbinned2851contig1000_22 [Prokaryotic dsDNA virus sp.]|tara:strand:- start:8013 stop:10613 length:2601 start_codon:yes stop_codon:yes gene_type:complete